MGTQNIVQVVAFTHQTRSLFIYKKMYSKWP